MYTLQEIEQKLGIKSYVILFWENNFPQIGKSSQEGTERSYTEDDLELFRRIQKYLYEEGLPMEEVQKKIREGETKSAPDLIAPAENRELNTIYNESDKEFLENVLERLDEILKILKSSK